MSRKEEHRIDDLIGCCEKIIRYTSGLTKEQLAEQEMVLDAVLRNIQVIGEAAKTLSEATRARMPGIEWKKIAGMRDWISHVYYRVDLDIVWITVERKIPELLGALEAFKHRDQP